MPTPLKLDRSPADPGAPSASAAHDLKNLLSVILGVCESLAERLTGAGELAELARVGLLAAERAGALASQMPPPDPAARGSVEPLTPQTGDGRGRTVLVVEDDPDLLGLITAGFARAGYRAYSARNGRLGVQLLRALKPDLMVTDIVMPETEGIAVIIEARRATAATAVIAISGGGAYGRSGSFLQWAEELGADAVMAKPFAMSRLLAVAGAALDRRAAKLGAG
ncbi:MAG: response regulator [Caulobacterales bacterium]|nr:response regulator [Caulobacterales bacterium]